MKTAIGILTVLISGVSTPLILNAETPSAAVSAQDQSNKPADAELTRKIRQEIMNRDVSLQAKNITIVTIDGRVTLKGDVPNTLEKNLLGEIAKGLSPKVTNNITVKQ